MMRMWEHAHVDEHYHLALRVSYIESELEVEDHDTTQQTRQA